MTDAAALLEACRARSLTLATAESCTGGLVAAALTAVPGSSDVVECGFVTYSDAAKQRLLGVREATLAAHGAVSEATAREMARGALERSGAALAVSCTGIAGPGGGSAAKPVGLVHMAAAHRDGRVEHRCATLGGDRDAVRAAAVRECLRLLHSLL